jgi:hypothetical protein
VRKRDDDYGSEVDDSSVVNNAGMVDDGVDDCTEHRTRSRRRLVVDGGINEGAEERRGRRGKSWLI